MRLALDTIYQHILYIGLNSSPIYQSHHSIWIYDDRLTLFSKEQQQIRDLRPVLRMLQT